MPTAENPCERCGLEKGDDQHLTHGDCVRALRRAMLKQRQLAESFSFDISMRYLAALEELAADPDVGIVYRGFIMEPSENDDLTPKFKVMNVPPQQVAGIFAAIQQEFHRRGDWTPLADAKHKAARYAYAAGRLTGMLQKLLRLSTDEDRFVVLGPDLKDEITALIGELNTQDLVGLDPPH